MKDNKNLFSRSVFCIIGTEFCERFSFCGLRTILSLYLRNVLLFPENIATIVYHVFIMMCYVVPFIGAFCADSYLGRYKTILYFSMVYLIGNVLMTLAATPPLQLPSLYVTMAGLALIAVGTGGIKPCVAAFGGDQFHLPYQKVDLQHFFSIFYFTLNFGGFAGMLLTPILRKGVSCFDDEECYALGFGFPAILMLVALLLFVIGRRWYRMKKPKDNVMTKFIYCSFYAMRQRCKRAKDEKKREHWLDYADNKYNKKLIYDMKLVFSVLYIFIPLPLFWTLFDQQGSRWTFQASRMDGRVMGMLIKPDQMQSINPAIVLVLIPFFDRIMYPFFNRKDIFQSQLHRMIAGGILAGLSFLIAGILEMQLEQTYPHMPDKDKASVNIINTLPCDVIVRNSLDGKERLLQATEFVRFRNVDPKNDAGVFDVLVQVPLECGKYSFKKIEHNLQLTTVKNRIDTVFLAVNAKNEVTAYITDPVDFDKSLNGKPRIRIVFIRTSNGTKDIAVILKSDPISDVYFVGEKSDISNSAYLELPHGIFTYTVVERNWPLKKGKLLLDPGGVYTFILKEDEGFISFAQLYTMTPANNVHMFWLIPQYFLISIAEIMFGISGLEFSFTQAPKCMKTISIASWYLSVALGNFLVIIVTRANFFSSQAHEFFLYGTLIILDMLLFMKMSQNYQFIQLEADSSEFNMEDLPLLTKESEMYLLNSTD